MTDDLIQQWREGQPCFLDKCRVMDAKSGCLCAASADALEAAKRENDALRAMIRVNAMRDHGMSHGDIDAAIAAALSGERQEGEG